MWHDSSVTTFLAVVENVWFLLLTICPMLIVYPWTNTSFVHFSLSFSFPPAFFYLFIYERILGLKNPWRYKQYKPVLAIANLTELYSFCYCCDLLRHAALRRHECNGTCDSLLSHNHQGHSRRENSPIFLAHACWFCFVGANGASNL